MPLPFGLANFAFAITKVNYFTFILSSVLGLLPSQFILCYIGSTLKSMSSVLANESTTKTATLVFLIQLVIAFFVMYYILNAAKIEIQKHIDTDINNENNNASNLIDNNVSNNCQKILSFDA